MPINSRAKGARCERELAGEINEKFPGAKARRGQQFSGLEGEDVVSDIDGLHIESKCVEALNIYAAVEQAERDAKENVPVVFHKKNNKPWLATVQLDDLPALVAVLMAHIKKQESRPVPTQ